MTVPARAAHLTVADAAAELACGIDTIHRAIRRGDLTALRYGRLVRIARADFDAFLASHQQAPARRSTRRSA